MENSMEDPQKTKNGFVIWSSNPTPGDISRENHNLERYMQLYVHCSTIYNRQDKKATYRSTDRWMDKDVVYTNNRILLSHKKKWNNAIFCNMDGPRDYYTKWNKAERKRQIPYDINYVESNMTQMNLSTKQK